jgi:hypothetical protein
MKWVKQVAIELRSLRAKSEKEESRYWEQDSEA